jgi:hypothetical protein
VSSPPVLAGIPAREGLSAIETMMGQPSYTTPHAEFGRPKPDFLVEELEKGARQQAAARAHAEAVGKAKRLLDGRDDK